MASADSGFRKNAELPHISARRLLRSVSWSQKGVALAMVPMVDCGDRQNAPTLYAIAFHVPKLHSMGCSLLSQPLSWNELPWTSRGGSAAKTA